MPVADGSAPGTLGALAQAYVNVQCTTILAAAEALAAHDEEAVHPTRVAVRRLRATLRTFPRVYLRGRRDHLATELRWWGETLGRLRDLQIIEQHVTAALDATDPSALAELADDRAAAWRACDTAATSTRFAALAAELDRWRTAPPFGAAAMLPASAARPAVDEAGASLDRRLRRTARAIARGEADAAERIHSARKAAKRHRYAVELARPVLEADADDTHDRLRALQDALGERQDAVVTLAWLDGMRGALDADAVAAVVAVQRGILADTAHLLTAEPNDPAAGGGAGGTL